MMKQKEIQLIKNKKQEGYINRPITDSKIMKNQQIWVS